MSIPRRRLLQLSTLGLAGFFTGKTLSRANNRKYDAGHKPIVVSTWEAGINANKGAWKVLRGGGRALDAVEQGVMVTESEQSCCVGLGAWPDRDGFVTLDASIMDDTGSCGSVAFIERIKHPISVARRVMEKTPHVMLAGAGAQQFAVEQGFALESGELSPDAKKAYQGWLKKSEYKPVVNIESKGGTAFAPLRLPDGSFNHDTIGMVALDAHGNLSGSCTTSGMAFKMRGRVGDSPIIGAGLFVDNEVGAATATGVGEEVIKICGTHLVVQLMAQGLHPEEACQKAVEKIIKNFKGREAALKDTQVGFIAINKQGEYGAYCMQKGFSYAVCYADDYNKLITGKHA
jgi:N4-(beta-N-acetylglucosaminyl)-L-asparaginase